MECEPRPVEGQTDPTQGVVHFAEGLLGFEAAKKYQLLGSPEEAPFLWLQMAEEPKMAFLLISPVMVVDDYHPDISTDDAASIGLTNPQEAMVFNIVTMHKDGSATVNLKGPIVINRHTLAGKQVVPLNSAEYALQHPLPVAKS